MAFRNHADTFTCVPDIGLVFCNLRLTGNRRRIPRRCAQRNSAQKANTAYQSTAARTSNCQSASRLATPAAQFDRFDIAGDPSGLAQQRGRRDVPGQQPVQQHADNREEVADQGEAQHQRTHRQPVEDMPDARRLFAQRRLAGVLQRQCQQAIGQGRHRAEQGIPEDHREEALVALPEQMAVHPADQFALAAAQDPQIAFGDMEGSLGLPRAARRRGTARGRP